MRRKNWVTNSKLIFLLVLALGDDPYQQSIIWALKPIFRVRNNVHKAISVFFGGFFRAFPIPCINVKNYFFDDTTKKLNVLLCCPSLRRIDTGLFAAAILKSRCIKSHVLISNSFEDLFGIYLCRSLLFIRY